MASYTKKVLDERRDVEGGTSRHGRPPVRGKCPIHRYIHGHGTAENFSEQMSDVTSPKADVQKTKGRANRLCPRFSSFLLDYFLNPQCRILLLAGAFPEVLGEGGKIHRGRIGNQCCQIAPVNITVTRRKVTILGI